MIRITGSSSTESPLFFLMTKTYIIDGYNLIHASADLKRTTEAFGIERARTDLVNALSDYVGRRKSKCTVVFDGVVPDGGGTARVRVISSRNRSADDLIREEARRYGKSLIVVSSDLEIVATAKVNLASVIGSKEFAVELGVITAAAGSGGGKPTDGSARPHRIEELRESSEKPGVVSDDDVNEWRKLFGA